MAWSPDVIAGVTIALVLALIGWGGTVYCWIHKKKVRQGEVSTVDTWLSGKNGAYKHSAAAGAVGGYAGFANTVTEGTELGEMRRQRERDLERGGDGSVVEGVDTTGVPQAPPPVYDERRERSVRRGSDEAVAEEDLEGATRRNSEVPGYQERP